MTKKEQLLEMEVCFWKTKAMEYMKPKEVAKYEDALEKEKVKLLTNIFN